MPAILPRRLARLGLIALAIAGCKAAERVVGVDAGTGNQTIKLSVGDLVDIRLYGGALGVFEARPSISSGAVTFVEVVRDGVPTPSQPVQRYRFRFKAVERGTAVLLFASPAGAPVTADTIVVN